MKPKETELKLSKGSGDFLKMVNPEQKVHITPNSDSQQEAGQLDTTENKNFTKKCCFRISTKTADILSIVRIRLALTVTVGYMIGTFYCVSNEPTIFIAIIPIIYFWAEAIYISIKNDAKEWYW